MGCIMLLFVEYGCDVYKHVYIQALLQFNQPAVNIIYRDVNNHELPARTISTECITKTKN